MALRCRDCLQPLSDTDKAQKDAKGRGLYSKEHFYPSDQAKGTGESFGVQAICRWDRDPKAPA